MKWRYRNFLQPWHLGLKEDHLNIKMNKLHVQANPHEEQSVWVRDFIPKE